MSDITKSREDSLAPMDEKDNPSESVTVKPQPAWAGNSDIPDGGWHAWVQVLAVWSLFFNTWGLLNTFGEYQTYYESGAIFTTSSSDISWIGSIQSFMLLFVGCFTGPLYDAGHLHLLLGVGTFMIVFGHMMLSLVNAFWQALLAQAFVIGIGAGCLFVPSVAVITGYFSTKLSTAMGLAASGSSIGGIIYPIMFHKLLPEIGFPWTVRVIGFMALGMLLVACAVLRMRVKPAAKRKLFDFAAFKEPPYAFFVFGGVMGWMGLLVPLFYVSYYGIASGITDTNLGFYLLPILNAASVFGRTVPNLLADKFGNLNIFIPAAVMSGILSFCLIPTKNVGGLVVVDLLYGFFSGTFVSLPAPIMVSLTPPEKRGMIGTRVGMGFCVIGFGVLAGTPIAGAILGEGPDLHFTATWAFGGALLLGATASFICSRIAKSGLRLMVKC